MEKSSIFLQSLGIPAPAVNAYFVSSLECFGGLLLIIGLASRPIALMVAISMFVAYWTADLEALTSIFSDPDKFVKADPFPYLLTALIVLAFGPGLAFGGRAIEAGDWTENFFRVPFVRPASLLNEETGNNDGPWTSILSMFLALVLLPFSRTLAEDDGITWQPWSDSVFAQAKSEGRFVLLDLGTVWCHWCHVMEEVTYRDPAVIDLVGQRYLAVRVDADARPDLSNRYEDYGWPATIVFNSDGSEIVKRRGYLPPGQMASMLQAIIDDPSPGPSVVAEAPLVAGGQIALGSDRQNALAPDFDRRL